MGKLSGGLSAEVAQSWERSESVSWGKAGQAQGKVEVEVEVGWEWVG